MKKMMFVTVLIAVVGSLAFLSKENSSSPASGLELGQVAPDFKLKNVDEKMIGLADVKDAKGDAPKGYIVVFTCNTCPFAVMYEDRLIDLHNKYAPKGWPVVAIQPNNPETKPGDGFEEMKVRASEKVFPFVYLLDEGQKIYPKYGATKTPHVFLLDKDRMVRYMGAIDNNAQDAEAASRHYVAEAIDAIEMGKEPDPASTKAIGCGIKN